MNSIVEISSSVPPQDTATTPSKSPLYPSLNEAPATPASPYTSYPYQTTPKPATPTSVQPKQSTPQQKLGTPQTQTPKQNVFQSPTPQKNAFQTPQKTPQTTTTTTTTQSTPQQQTPQNTFMSKLQSPEADGPKAATNLPNKGIFTEGETTMHIPAAELFVYDEASQSFILKERSVEVLVNYTGDEEKISCI